MESLKELPAKILRSIVVLLARVAGVRPDAIREVPMSLGLASTLGALMLLTTTNAAWTAGYALFVAFDGSRTIATVGGICWAACVFCIDRALLLTLDKSANWKRRMSQLLIRIPLAALIGITMSKPLVLRLSESAIQRELFRERQSDLKQASQLYAATTEVGLRRSRWQEAKTDLAAARGRLQGEPDSARYRTAAIALRGAKARRSAAIARLDHLRKELLASAGREVPAVASRVRQAGEIITMENKAVLQSELEISRAADEFRAEAANDLEKAQAASTAAAARQEAAEHLFEEKQNDAEVETRAFSKSDLLNRYRIFRLITEGNGPDAKSLSAFAFAADSLLILIELIPILVKLLAPIDSLDEAQRTLTVAEKEAAIYRDRIGGNKRMRAAQLEEDLTNKLADSVRSHLEKRIEKADLTDHTIASELTETIRRNCKIIGGNQWKKTNDTDLNEDKAASE